MKLSTRQLIPLSVLCVVLFGVVIWALYAEHDRPWKTYQRQFRQLMPAKSVKDNPGGIRQIWNEQLGAVDRCVTCHEGIDDPHFVNAGQPFKTHSGNYLKHHPVEKFGCVVCHEGQGPALTADAAHGEAGNWPKPMLRGVFAQSSCLKCHSARPGKPLSASLEGASVLSEGRRLFDGHNCAGCHKLSPQKDAAYIAPVLTSVGSKVNREWLVKWLKDPKDYLSDAKMPKFNLSNEEIEYIADYLMDLSSTSSGVLQDSPAGPKGPSHELAAIEGKNVISSLGCLGCHSVNGSGNNFAPDLSNIGSKVNVAWLVQFLRNPKEYQPKTSMPNLNISEADIQRIADYLISLKAWARLTVPMGQPSQAGNNTGIGRKLVKDKGCTGCHEIDNLSPGYDAPSLDEIGGRRVDQLAFGNITGIDRTLISWLMMKVRDPQKFATDKIVTRMPSYNFSETQTEALVTYLLGLRKDTVPSGYKITASKADRQRDEARAAFEKYNCRGCHMIGNTGGTIGPDLSREARKSRSEWLFTFLKSPYKIRPLPMLKAGMPDFNLSDSEVNTIIEYLSFISEEPYPYNFEPKKEIGPEDVWNGEKLYQEIFACTGCHTINGHGGQVGPEQTDVASRLKREWIKQWLENPQAIKPDVSMPRFRFKDWELEAVTDYMMTLGKHRFVDIKSAD